MGDILVKLRILWRVIRVAIADWRAQVWRRELDEHYCCDGHMCGCGAATVREVYDE